MLDTRKRIDPAQSPDPKTPRPFEAYRWRWVLQFTLRYELLPRSSRIGAAALSQNPKFPASNLPHKPPATAQLRCPPRFWVSGSIEFHLTSQILTTKSPNMHRLGPRGMTRRQDTMAPRRGPFTSSDGGETPVSQGGPPRSNYAQEPACHAYPDPDEELSLHSPIPVPHSVIRAGDSPAAGRSSSVQPHAAAPTCAPRQPPASRSAHLHGVQDRRRPAAAKGQPAAFPDVRPRGLPRGWHGADSAPASVVLRFAACAARVRPALPEAE
jgi:hypothetical protein